MKKNNIPMLVTIGLMIITCVSCTESKREKEMMKQGEVIIKKIEDYKQSHKALPNSLSDIGIEERDGMDVLYYYKRDSLHYTVSFPISAEEHRFYYSDSKKWEYGYRDMR